MKKTFSAALVSTLAVAALSLYAACADDPVPGADPTPEGGPPPTSDVDAAIGATNDAGTDAAVTCRPGERAITLVNKCASTDIWVGWAGNDGTAGCQTNAECPAGTTCDHTTKTCLSVASASCSSARDCPGVNQFCNTGTPSYSTNCRVTADCDGTRNESCNQAQTGYFGLADGGAQPSDTCQPGTPVEPDAGPDNQPEDPGCVALINAGTLTPNQPTHAFCDRTAVGAHRCAFHQCGSNKCYFAPVPIADIPPSASTCSAPADCKDPGQFCYVPQGTPIGVTPAGVGRCVAVPNAGANGQKLTHPANPDGKHQVTICVPTPWAGRFWPRTGCTPGDGGTLACQTGNCTGQKAGTFAESCALSGIDSPTLGELYFPPFGAGTNGAPGSPDDFYDVSLVDGVTVPMQIAPANYDPAAGRSGTPCDPQNDRCAADVGVEMACDPTLKVCVNKFECASPGCVSNCGTYGNGRFLGAGSNCKWTGDLGLSEAECPAVLRARANGGAYVGCLSPKDFCAKNAGDPLCTPENRELFGCNGTDTKVSCYDPASGPTCCGCPTWMPDAGLGGCHAYNPTWESVAGGPYYSKFHEACPTSYTFPFDDKSATFTCRAKSASANVDYTITFCPK